MPKPAPTMSALDYINLARESLMRDGTPESESALILLEKASFRLGDPKRREAFFDLTAFQEAGIGAKAIAFSQKILYVKSLEGVARELRERGILKAFAYYDRFPPADAAQFLAILCKRQLLSREEILSAIADGPQSNIRQKRQRLFETALASA